MENPDSTTAFSAKPQEAGENSSQPQDPFVATISAPANPEATEGGEWQELLSVLNNWLGEGKIKQIWEQSQSPIKAVGLAIVVLILLKLVGAVLGTLDGIPMLPKLLELVGLIWIGLFAGQKLIKRSERKAFFNQLSGTWQSFTGKKINSNTSSAGSRLIT